MEPVETYFVDGQSTHISTWRRTHVLDNSRAVWMAVFGWQDSMEESRELLST